MASGNQGQLYYIDSSNTPIDTYGNAMSWVDPSQAVELLSNRILYGDNFGDASQIQSYLKNIGISPDQLNNMISTQMAGDIGRELAFNAQGSNLYNSNAVNNGINYLKSIGVNPDSINSQILSSAQQFLVRSLQSSSPGGFFGAIEKIAPAVALGIVTGGVGAAFGGAELATSIGTGLGLSADAGAATVGTALLNSASSAVLAQLTGGDVTKSAIAGAISGGAAANSADIANALTNNSVNTIAQSTGLTPAQVANTITNAVTTGVVTAAVTGGDVGKAVASSLASSGVSAEVQNTINDNLPNMSGTAKLVGNVAGVATKAAVSGTDIGTAIQSSIPQIIGGQLQDTTKTDTTKPDTANAAVTTSQTDTGNTAVVVTTDPTTNTALVINTNGDVSVVATTDNIPSGSTVTINPDTNVASISQPAIQTGPSGIVAGPGTGIVSQPEEGPVIDISGYPTTKTNVSSDFDLSKLPQNTELADANEPGAYYDENSNSYVKPKEAEPLPIVEEIPKGTDINTISVIGKPDVGGGGPFTVPATIEPVINIPDIQPSSQTQKIIDLINQPVTPAQPSITAPNVTPVTPDVAQPISSKPITPDVTAQPDVTTPTTQPTQIQQILDLINPPAVTAPTTTVTATDANVPSQNVNQPIIDLISTPTNAANVTISAGGDTGNVSGTTFANAPSGTANGSVYGTGNVSTGTIGTQPVKDNAPSNILAKEPTRPEIVVEANAPEKSKDVSKEPAATPALTSILSPSIIPSKSVAQAGIAGPSTAYLGQALGTTSPDTALSGGGTPVFAGEEGKKRNVWNIESLRNALGI